MVFLKFTRLATLNNMAKCFICTAFFLLTIIPYCLSQWQFVGSPEAGRPLNFAGHKDSLFVCAEAGLFFSQDQGNTWIELNTPDTIAFFKQVSFQNGDLYIVTLQRHDDVGNILVFRSSDFGTTWV